MATVDRSRMTTVDSNSMTTVGGFPGNRIAGLHSAASILKNLSPVPDPPPAGSSDMTTVVIERRSTVVTLPTVDAGLSEARLADPCDNRDSHRDIQDSPYMATVDTSACTTVVIPPPQAAPDERKVLTDSNVGGDATSSDWARRGREASLSKSDSFATGVDMSTVGMSGLTTVPPLEPPQQKPSQHPLLWITEEGDLVRQARVKRIRLAQDVINSAEESVYDTLWSAKVAQTDDRDSSRIVQAGYDYLGKRTRLSKKTIQRIVAKLLDKDFIAIERPADIYQRTSTVYRVFSYKTVLDRHVQKGRSHVAKMGPGFLYVRPMDDPRQRSSEASPLPAVAVSPAQPIDVSAVVLSRSPTVVSTGPSTPVNKTTDTVVHSNMSTVVRYATSYIDKDDLDRNTSSSSSGIYAALAQYGAVDDDILARLTQNCKEQAPDCSEEEIIHFIQEKGTIVRGRTSQIYSPIGFLLTAVPKCFGGEAFRFYREERRKQREAEAAQEAKRQAELDQWKREQEAVLADPSVSEKQKEEIRKFLGVCYPE